MATPTLVRIPLDGGEPVELTPEPQQAMRLAEHQGMLYWSQYRRVPPGPEDATLLAMPINGGRPTALVRHCYTEDVLVRGCDVFATTNCHGLIRLPALAP